MIIAAVERKKGGTAGASTSFLGRLTKNEKKRKRAESSKNNSTTDITKNGIDGSTNDSKKERKDPSPFNSTTMVSGAGGAIDELLPSATEDAESQTAAANVLSCLRGDLKPGAVMLSGSAANEEYLLLVGGRASTVLRRAGGTRSAADGNDMRMAASSSGRGSGLVTNQQLGTIVTSVVSGSRSSASVDPSGSFAPRLSSAAAIAASDHYCDDHDDFHLVSSSSSVGHDVIINTGVPTHLATMHFGGGVAGGYELRRFPFSGTMSATHKLSFAPADGSFYMPQQLLRPLPFGTVGDDSFFGGLGAASSNRSTSSASFPSMMMHTSQQQATAAAAIQYRQHVLAASSRGLQSGSARGGAAAAAAATAGAGSNGGTTPTTAALSRLSVLSQYTTHLRNKNGGDSSNYFHTCVPSPQPIIYVGCCYVSCVSQVSGYVDDLEHCCI
jgi:hypothetical protein